MSRKTKHVYVPIAVPPDVKQHIQQIAKSERRSMSQQAGELLELGLAEYERRKEQRDDVESGKTQINAEALNGRR